MTLRDGTSNIIVSTTCDISGRVALFIMHIVDVSVCKIKTFVRWIASMHEAR